MPLDPSLDWQQFTVPTPRAITITSIRTSNLPSVAYSVTWSQRGKCSYRMTQLTNGAYVRPEATYLVPKHVLAGQGAGPWKPGDTITDANEQDPTQQTATPVTYTIQVADNDDYYWLLAVFNPKIAFNLRDTVDIVLNTGSVSSILTRTTSASDVSTSVVCRKQPTSTQMMTLLGRQGNVRMFDVYFASNQTLLPDRHVLRWTESGSPVIADIVSVTDSERIDVCQKVTVEVRP
jgi:hypothetical protein